MKIRLNFVSNSSTSSFIVAVPKNSKADLKVAISVDLSRYAEEILSSKEDLDKYTKGNYTKYSEDFSDYNKFLDLIKSGKSIYIGSFSNESDDPISQLLCDLGIINTEHSSDMEIIEGEGGY
jgi:hypothetical protein